MGENAWPVRSRIHRSRSKEDFGNHRGRPCKEMTEIRTFVGDCFDVLRDMERESVDLVYVDPPFFTQKTA